MGAELDAQREYDRFGPWVVEVSDDDPVPPLFAHAIDRPDLPILSIKIPRDVDRRATAPGADLYDYLVSLYDQDLVVHQRVGREVRTETCRYRDVRYLRIDRDLLLGNLHLDLPGHSFDLPHSTVSNELMGRVAELIRGRYTDGEATADRGTQIHLEEGDLSFYFHRLLDRDRAAATGMRVVAAQGTVGVGSPAMTLGHRLAARLAGQRLLESMHLTDGRELMIVGHRRPYASWWQSPHGDDTTYLPLANIEATTWRDDERHGATELVLRVGEGTSTHVFAKGNPSVSSYAAFLDGLAGPVTKAA